MPAEVVLERATRDELLACMGQRQQRLHKPLPGLTRAHACRPLPRATDGSRIASYCVTVTGPALFESETASDVLASYGRQPGTPPGGDKAADAGSRAQPQPGRLSLEGFCPLSPLESTAVSALLRYLMQCRPAQGMRTARAAAATRLCLARTRRRRHGERHSRRRPANAHAAAPLRCDASHGDGRADAARPGARPGAEQLRRGRRRARPARAWHAAEVCSPRRGHPLRRCEQVRGGGRSACAPRQRAPPTLRRLAPQDGDQAHGCCGSCSHPRQTWRPSRAGSRNGWRRRPSGKTRTLLRGCFYDIGPSLRLLTALARRAPDQDGPLPPRMQEGLQRPHAGVVPPRCCAHLQHAWPLPSRAP